MQGTIVSVSTIGEPNWLKGRVSKGRGRSNVQYHDPRSSISSYKDDTDLPKRKSSRPCLTGVIRSVLDVANRSWSETLRCRRIKMRLERQTGFVHAIVHRTPQPPSHHFQDTHHHSLDQDHLSLPVIFFFFRVNWGSRCSFAFIFIWSARVQVCCTLRSHLLFYPFIGFCFVCCSVVFGSPLVVKHVLSYCHHRS